MLPPAPITGPIALFGISMSLLKFGYLEHTSQYNGPLITAIKR